jgi:hypothetical protein
MSKLSQCQPLLDLVVAQRHCLNCMSFGTVTVMSSDDYNQSFDAGPFAGFMSAQQSSAAPAARPRGEHPARFTSHHPSFLLAMVNQRGSVCLGSSLERAWPNVRALLPVLPHVGPTHELGYLPSVAHMWYCAAHLTHKMLAKPRG